MKNAKIIVIESLDDKNNPMLSYNKVCEYFFIECFGKSISDTSVNVELLTKTDQIPNSFDATRHPPLTI